MQTIKAGALYFALVFVAGFALGSVRVWWVVPRVGERMAELLEMPLMLLVSALAAGWVARRLALAPRASRRLAMGGIALALLLLAEFTLVLWLRGLSIGDYLALRDPVSTTVYFIALGLFGLMPLWVARHQGAVA